MNQNKKGIYVDNSATTPVLEEVWQAMLPYFKAIYGNPSSIHLQGACARKAVEESRERIAQCLNCHPDELFFTSGGTESNNLAVYGLAMASTHKNLLASRIEHPSVLNTMKAMEKFDFRTEYIAVDSLCEISKDSLLEKIRCSPALVAVMHANNETGVLQPVEMVAETVHEYGSLFFSDAVQAIGNTEVDLSKEVFDALSFSGHKIGGPKGIGALYVKRGTPIVPLIWGGGQERGLRSGTENIPGIVGLAAAVELATNKLAEIQSVKTLRNQLVSMMRTIPMSYFYGIADRIIPGLIHVCFDYVDGSDLVRYLNQNGIYASSSSACAAHSNEPSHVLLAMGIPYERARGSLRISINRNNTLDEIQYIAEKTKEAVGLIRNMNAEYRARFQ